MKLFRYLGAASLALALALTARGALAGSEAVPASIYQDQTAGCSAYVDYANRPGPDLTTFGAACSPIKGVAGTLRIDHSHGFGLRSGLNVSLGRIGPMDTVVSMDVSVPFGGLLDVLNSTTLHPSVLAHNRNLLGPVGVGMQYTADIPVSANHGFAPPDRHGGAVWLSAVLAKDANGDPKFEVYGKGSVDFYGSPNIAACGECLSKSFSLDFLGSSSQIEAGGGFNFYTHGFRLSFEGSAPVDSSPFGDRRTLFFALRKSL